ncbi:MAG: Rossman fold protein, TIGR00730 family [Candidatus Melainabacteria bacterium GWF2_37_15]|nr:MAG: Rossman fold protein, TIGR00730 family [Candidatus Melainabacteria bacterium GWF2_37_15]
MKNICVYCSSSNLIDPVFFQAAKQLAVTIASKQHRLVFGVGCVGLMGELARTMHDFGGHVTGVIPHRLNVPGICYENCDELIVTKDMRKRKHKMDEVSDGFIALPGGFGTLEEISEMITGKQLGFHNKPLVFLNTNNFYSPLIDFFEQMYAYNFAKPESRSLYFVSDKPEACIEYIEKFIPEEISEKYERKV